MTHFALQPHVHAVETDGDVVLMDARANQYYCVPRSAAVGLLEAVTTPGRFRPDLPIVADLEAAGMFGMLDRGPVRQAIPSLATAELGEAVMPHLQMASWTVGIALHAVRARLRLRFHSPEQWLRNVAARNARYADHVDRERVMQIAVAVREAHVFLPGFSRCLPNSLLLLEVLHASRQPARWVFGVRTFPFEAHCWVEHEGMVLNDRLEHVRWFTPLVSA